MSGGTDLVNNEQLLDQLYQKVKAQSGRLTQLFPYLAVDRHYEPTKNQDRHNWTNGFYPGILWQFAQAFDDASLREAATTVEDGYATTLADFQHLDHDVGFLFLPSSVIRYQLTGAEDAKARGLQAAIVLASRFNPQGQFIRCWNGRGKEGWTIIDSLLNMPLLYWASAVSGDPRFAQIAVAHTTTVRRYHLRADGSTYHVVSFDPTTGEFIGPVAGQGYAPTSVWSRGQAWAVYGFALAYQATGQPEFLTASQQAAHYFIAHTAATDGLSLVDFAAPAEPVIYDLSAAACAASGFGLLATLVPAPQQAFYRAAAEHSLTTLAVRDIDADPTHDGLLQRATSAYDRDYEREQSLIYGDYFIVEALLRQAGRNTHIFDIEAYKHD